jgi:ligand-binding sensor domain-containing protein
LKILRHFGRVVFVLTAVLVWGCEDETTVAPPPPVPQISLQMITGMSSDDAYDVFVDSHNRLWVSTEGGVYQFKSPEGPFNVADTSKVRWFTDRDGLPNLRCRGVNEFNGEVYVATWGGGLGVYGGVTPWLTIPPVNDLLAGRVFELAPDDTSMWLATVEGVVQYVDNGAASIEDRLIPRTGAFGSGKFSSIVVLTGVGGRPDSGQVWVSEETGDFFGIPIPGGIRFLGLPGPWSQYFEPGTSAIPSSNCAEVAYDPVADLVWSAHPANGVATVDLLAKTWRTYTVGSGLVSNLAVSVAINHLGLKWPVGTVWVATQEGLTRIEPDRKTMVNYASGSGLPTIRVRKVVVDRNDDVWLCFVDGGVGKVVR